jgi:hypothetical protein
MIVTPGVHAQALRTCPVCRQRTDFVTPSLVWPADGEEKAAILGAYRAKLGGIDCRYFDFGEGTCPFSTSCMYRHAYPNGQLEVNLTSLSLAASFGSHKAMPCIIWDLAC